MHPIRYRPSTGALEVLLMLSNYLRDLNVESTGPFLAPHIKNFGYGKAIERMVRESLREINTKAGKDDDLRLTLRLSKAQEMLEPSATARRTRRTSPRSSTSSGSTTSTRSCPAGRRRSRWPACSTSWPSPTGRATRPA